MLSGLVIAWRRGDLADQPLPVLGERDDRRRGPPALLVRDDLRLAAFHDGDHRVGRAQVDADHAPHRRSSQSSKAKWNQVLARRSRSARQARGQTFGVKRRRGTESGGHARRTRAPRRRSSRSRRCGRTRAGGSGCRPRAGPTIAPTAPLRSDRERLGDAEPVQAGTGRSRPRHARRPGTLIRTSTDPTATSAPRSGASTRIRGGPR